MCIFSRDITAVFATKIFTRKAAPDRQYLVYEMGYQAPEELAMILPLPIAKNAGEESIRFIDLSNYGEFFNDLDSPFDKYLGRSLSITPPNNSRLKVHHVGSFEASFVPSPGDFGKLDPRFTLPPELWSELAVYQDYGFAVFRLKPEVNQVHPMAMEFKSNCHGALFFPTMHIHDRQFKLAAEFDHRLYCQKPLPTTNWEMSEKLWSWDNLPVLSHAKPQSLPAAKFLDIDRCQGMVDPDLPVQKMQLQGRYENKDLLIPLRHY